VEEKKGETAKQKEYRGQKEKGKEKAKIRSKRVI
jgi:hypothetical protein